MHFFVCIYSTIFLYNSTRFERPFRSSSGVHDLLYLQLCTNQQTWRILQTEGESVYCQLRFTSYGRIIYPII